MVENEQKARRMDRNRFIDMLKSRHKYPDEVLNLVKEDMEYGLSDEQVTLYLKQGYNIGQMKVLSHCLRDNVPGEVMEILQKYSLSSHQMQVVLDFYEKGIAVSDIEQVVAKKDMPVAMKAAFNKILEKVEAVKKEAVSEPEYVQGLIKQIEEVAAKIICQDEKYEALNKKLSMLVTDRADDEVKENLVSELEIREATINDQQNRLNEASATIARLRNDVEKKEKEMKRMEGRIDILEDRLVNAENVRDRAKEIKPEMDLQGNLGMVSGQGPKPEAFVMPQAAQSVPIYYQVPVMDGRGHCLQNVPIERTVKKSSGIGSLLAKLGFLKKSRADIVKLVASGSLVPAQLVQIKSAIEKGLTEGQLVELINNNVAAEKMKEIIEIAVLENRLGI